MSPHQKMVEVLAGREACSVALLHHLSSMQFESNSSLLVNFVKDLVPHMSIIGLVHDDIVCSLLRLCSSFNHIYCEANSTAYNLTRYVLSSSLDVIWVGEFPPSIQRLISKKCTH